MGRRQSLLVGAVLEGVSASLCVPELDLITSGLIGLRSHCWSGRPLYARTGRHAARRHHAVRGDWRPRSDHVRRAARR